MQHTRTGKIKFKKMILIKASVYDSNNPLIKEILAPETAT